MSPSPTPTAAPPIVTSARASVMILTAAQAGAVPLPEHVWHTQLRDGAVRLTFHVAGLDDLAAWSTWLEEPLVVAEEVTEAGLLHCSVDGVLFDAQVRVLCMVPADAIEAVPV